MESVVLDYGLRLKGSVSAEDLISLNDKLPEKYAIADAPGLGILLLYKPARFLAKNIPYPIKLSDWYKQHSFTIYESELGQVNDAIDSYHLKFKKNGYWEWYLIDYGQPPTT